MKPERTVLSAWLLATLGSALTGCGSPADPMSAAPVASEADADVFGVTLDAEQQARLGVSVARLEATEFEQRVEGTGIVINVQPIVESMASVITAEAAVRQSGAARERAASLFGADAAVSREVLEAAVRQSASDQAALDVARAQAVVAFGSSAPWLDAARRGEILRRLTGGEAAVVRLSFPGGMPTASPHEVSLRRVGAASGEGTWNAAEVWNGPADPAVPGPALMVYVESAAGLAQGTRVVGSFGAGVRERGVVVPASAVVFAGGAAWCFLVDGGDSFSRAAVDLRRPLADGYFQSSGFEPGGSVVIAGAGLLLAREMSGIEEED